MMVFCAISSLTVTLAKSLPETNKSKLGRGRDGGKAIFFVVVVTQMWPFVLCCAFLACLIGCKSFYSAWRMRVPGGSEVFLLNHRFMSCSVEKIALWRAYLGASSKLS